MGQQPELGISTTLAIFTGASIMTRAGILNLTFALVLVSNLNAGTTLSRAAISGDINQIKVRIDAGEDVNEIDKWGLTPLMWAVYYRYIPAAQYLLEHKADPNVQATASYGSVPNKGTALIIAAYYGLEAHVTLLLQHGANPELLDDQGKKAIDYAQKYNFHAIVTMLSRSKLAPAEKSDSTPAINTKATAAQSSPVKEKPITNQDVMNMLLAYRGDVFVINKIKKSSRQSLDVTPSTLSKLRELGVSKAVLDAMIQRAKNP
jgi:ankyrin repeat protein